MAAPRPDLLARRVVQDIMIYTRGVKMRWVPVETVARRLASNDDNAAAAALKVAEAKGWLTIKDGVSVCLTDAGRRIANR
jgi:hypothetical protein